MKRAFYALAALALVLTYSCQKPNTHTDVEDVDKPDPTTEEVDPSQYDETDYTMPINVTARPDDFVDSGNKADIAYQLLVYSFADSNGDGIGDFKGVQEHLDYIASLGATAIWLSPIHPAMSYHGYDITDYNAVNREYGTEDDLKNLIHAAHQKGIKIYLDYVLNHAGNKHPYFQSAASSKEDRWRTAFIFSSNPAADIKAGKIPMIPSTASYESSQWYTTPSNGSLGASGRFHFTVKWGTTPTVTVTKTTEAAQSSNSDSSVKQFIFYGNGTLARMYPTGNDVYEITLDFNSDWGFLVRTSDTAWGKDKWGAASGDQAITFGTPKVLVNDDAANDITFAAAEFYHSHMWTGYFADWNYHKAESSEKSLAFNHLASTADKWISMGVDGLRLDAVKHIYWNAASAENPTFLGKWYNRCNEAYKQAGGKGDIYMVGEQYGEAEEVAQYYKGLPAFFEFSFWNRLQWVLNERTGCYFVKDIMGYQKLYEKYRSDYIEVPKLSNHDETRTGTTLGKSLAKMKQAGAFLLTAQGNPYIYSGEELGYWGAKDNGDEWVRTPMMWKADGTGLASKKLGSKIDRSMLTAGISVESQAEDAESILNVYRTFGQARSAHESLGQGKMSAHAKYNDSNTSAKSISAWYMTSSAEKSLVLHNVASSSVTVTLPDDKLSSPIVSLGTFSVEGTSVTLGANSSVVFLQ